MSVVIMNMTSDIRRPSVLVRAVLLAGLGCVVWACSQKPAVPREAAARGPTSAPSVTSSAPVSSSPSVASRLPSPTQTPAPDASGGAYMGRVLAEPMGYQAAWWLERADRDATQKPEHVLDVMGVHEGQTVADIGCGSGYFSVRLSKRVGASGRVLATDVQKEMLSLLQKKIDAGKLTNITPILATESDVSLPRAAVDIVLMVDVYHELAHPRAAAQQIRAALRPDGKLVLVEYRAEDPEVAIRPEHKMTLAQLRAELDASGYAFVSSDESLPEQRIVTFVPR